MTIERAIGLTAVVAMAIITGLAMYDAWKAN